MPDEMGKYNSFLLGNAIFVHSSKIYFIYFNYFAAVHTCVCACGDFGLHFCVQTQAMGGHVGRFHP